MTQNASDVEIANQGFAAFRQDLNDVLEDITTLHSGTAAPTTTYANQWWYETDTDKLYIRNEDNDAWIEILTLDQANDHLATLGASITLDGTGNVSIDSGDFTVDTDTLYVDSTNNNVLVGKTARAANTAGIELLGIGASVHSYAGEVVKVNRLTNDGPITSFYRDNTKVGTIIGKYGDLAIGTGNTTIRFDDSQDIIYPGGGDGSGTDSGTGLGASNRRFGDLFLSGGVYLGGTGSANHLDDYEEGTWTPSFEMVSGSATFSYQGRAGYYTKIGRLVTVHFAVHSSGVTVTTDGKVRISGLPFTASNANALLRSYSVGFKQLIDTAEVGILYAINNNSNYIEMYEGHTTYPESNRLIDASILVSDRRVRGVLQYLV